MCGVVVVMNNIVVRALHNTSSVQLRALSKPSYQPWCKGGTIIDILYVRTFKVIAVYSITKPASVIKPWT